MSDKTGFSSASMRFIRDQAEAQAVRDQAQAERDKNPAESMAKMAKTMMDMQAMIAMNMTMNTNNKSLLLPLTQENLPAN